MLDESWHGRKTAHDDTDGKLGPSPETHEFQVVGYVRRFGDLKAVIGPHDGCPASAIKE